MIRDYCFHSRLRSSPEAYCYDRRCFVFFHRNFTAFLGPKFRVFWKKKKNWKKKLFFWFFDFFFLILECNSFSPEFYCIFGTKIQGFKKEKKTRSKVLRSYSSQWIKDYRSQKFIKKIVKRIVKKYRQKIVKKIKNKQTKRSS